MAHGTSRCPQPAAHLIGTLCTHHAALLVPCSLARHWVSCSLLCTRPAHQQDEFCAGGSKLLAGACPGDRGAPATQSVEGTLTQVMVVVGETDRKPPP